MFWYHPPPPLKKTHTHTPPTHTHTHTHTHSNNNNDFLYERTLERNPTRYFSRWNAEMKHWHLPLRVHWWLTITLRPCFSANWLRNIKSRAYHESMSRLGAKLKQLKKKKLLQEVEEMNHLIPLFWDGNASVKLKWWNSVEISFRYQPVTFFAIPLWKWPLTCVGSLSALHLHAF